LATGPKVEAASSESYCSDTTPHLRYLYSFVLTYFSEVNSLLTHYLSVLLQVVTLTNVLSCCSNARETNVAHVRLLRSSVRRRHVYDPH